MSALRRWLRGQRAEEWAARWVWGKLWEVHASPDDVVWRAVVLCPEQGDIREPNADLHVHGRDCDFKLTYLKTDNHEDIDPNWVEPYLSACRISWGAGCNVDGVYRYPYVRNTW